MPARDPPNNPLHAPGVPPAFARMGLGTVCKGMLAAALATCLATPAMPSRATTAPARGPTLVVDPGFHTAPVRRVALSADERLVATASDDKTVALWRADTGERLHVLRGTPGPGAQGRMYGVAFHPQRNLVAIGGTGIESSAGTERMGAADSTSSTGSTNIAVRAASAVSAAGASAAGAVGPRAGATILLHAADSGEFVRAIDAGRGEIKRLLWSPDGRWLLATFAAPGALKVFSPEGRLAAEVPLRGDGYGLAVHEGQRVAAADSAGAVALYALAVDGGLAPQARTELGGTPVAVAFAPAGDRLAVVHFDPARQGAVTVLDARSAAVLATWRAPRLARGRLQAVAWSRDGSRLAVGGVHSPEGVTGRAAIDALRGVVQEFDARTGTATALHEVAADAVTDLQARAGGGFVYASFDGRWGTVGLTGGAGTGSSTGSAGSTSSTPPGASPGPTTPSRPLASSGLPDQPAARPAAQHDAVRRPDRLWLAPGPVVQWQGAGAAAPQHFNMAERVVRAGAAAQAQPPTEPGTFSGTRDWDSVANAVPMLLGTAMPLDVGEISRAVARIPGSDDVAWGTGHRLARVAPGGKVVWSQKPGTETRAVHASADGRLVVAAMSDGTLRWLRARDGALLLSLYVLDPLRWVLWSPSGYYDASGGAEPMLGWLLATEARREGSNSAAGARGNEANGEGDRYVSVARFRQRFLRPDVIDRLLVELDEPAALEHADRARAQALREEAAAVAVAAQPVTAAPIAPPAPAAPITAPAPTSAAPPSLPAVAQALADLRATLPPVLVYKQAPTVTTENAQVTLDFGIRLQANEALTTLVVRRDGLLQEDARVVLPNVLDGSAATRVTVAVPPGDSVVHVSAANSHGFSDALSFKVHRQMPAPLLPPTALPTPAAAAPAFAPAPVPAPMPAVVPAPAPSSTPSTAAVPTPAPAAPTLPAPEPSTAARPTEAAPAKPRLFALLVGVGRYADTTINALDMPAKDAEDMARVLNGQSGRAYHSVQARVLTDQQATRNAIVAGLEWLSRSVGPQDFGVLFIAGHALNHANGSYYFLGHDTVADRLAATAVAQAQIRTTLARLKGRAVLFVDTCHAGNVFGAGRTPSREQARAPSREQSREHSRDLSRLVNELASPENGVIVFASSTGRQLSLESREWGNGAFTRAIVAGLNGAADFMGRGRVTFQGLGYYVSAEVEKLTGGRQTPVVIAPPPGLPDFTLALLQTSESPQRPQRDGARLGPPLAALPTHPPSFATHTLPTCPVSPASTFRPASLITLAVAEPALRGGSL